MKLYVGVTDGDWFRFLSSRPDIDEVNFWQPSGGREFKVLAPGQPFLFKLHYPHNVIVGGGFFACWSQLPVSMAWETFREKNGAGSLAEMRQRVGRYRRQLADPREDYVIGCTLLQQPFFLAESDWIPMPASWSANIVQGKGYGTLDGDGRWIWERVVAAAGAATVPELVADPAAPQLVAEAYGKPTLVYPRLGQGSFRVVVTDIYDRRCAATGERTLPVLEAAHIRPYAEAGPHDPRNGLLLRSDLHTLFDRGYLTVTPERKLEVSRRIREEFENGREYYRLHGQPLRPPRRPDLAPGREYLDWHATHVFRG